MFSKSNAINVVNSIRNFMSLLTDFVNFIVPVADKLRNTIA